MHDLVLSRSSREVRPRSFHLFVTTDVVQKTPRIRVCNCSRPTSLIFVSLDHIFSSSDYEESVVR